MPMSAIGVRRLITAHTHKSHSLHISEWQLSHGKKTVDSSEPTGTNRQKEQFKLDPKSKDIVFIHAV